MISNDIYINENNEVIDYFENNENSSYFQAMVLDYDLNFNIKYINLIADYYNIKKTKLNKRQLINKIVAFEIDIKNLYSVEERKRLFDNFIELKNNRFFSKFIIYN